MLTTLGFNKYSLGTSFFRYMSEQEKAATYRILSGKTIKEVAIDTGLKKTSIIRAGKALADGRECGVNGRPSALNSKEQELFLERVIELLALKEEIDYETAGSLVLHFLS